MKKPLLIWWFHYALLFMGANTVTEDSGLSDTLQLDFLAYEVQHAIKQQTDTIRDAIRELTRAFRDLTSFSLPKILLPLTNSSTSCPPPNPSLDHRITFLVESLGELRKELNKIKRDARKSAAQLESLQEIRKPKVYFDAFRDTGFQQAGNLTFSACSINIGNGMNITNGVFTAPSRGVYFFSFHANTVQGNDGLVLLRHNGFILAGAFDTDNFKHNTLAQTTLCHMNHGDQVWVDVVSGGVRSNDNLYVHLVGMLID